MSRTYRRRTIKPRQWSYHAPWADWRFRYNLEELKQEHRVNALFHCQWGIQPHHPPAFLRRQLEGRLRARHRDALSQVTLGEESQHVELTPYRWIKGIGWFWGW